ncbi:predicted protein [Micromonas commoda]|uniref:Thioredoxin domain-containing protein n=1 Tax=Micromonas commoda (strain RCC299 / NOUM17 / CCMP2709) TaxID=296587 RepID=C1E4J3_MICCC|nr:predicted protein [Micromonas commoda]ACO63128.1 predicted protein [Micromonas commoda]|eukprot:XP_002501870.1 predicted protein [Micromonas commoda]
MRACADTFANLAASGTRARVRRQSSLASRSRVAVAAPLARASRVAPRGRGRGAALAIRAAGTIQKVTKSELEEVMKDRSTPLVIDFYATWCGPCVLIASELEKVKAELGDGVRIVKVDTDEEDELSTQLSIQGLPTLVFVGTDTSKPALRTEGMLPAEMVKTIIANEL